MAAFPPPCRLFLKPRCLASGGDRERLPRAGGGRPFLSTHRKGSLLLLLLPARQNTPRVLPPRPVVRGGKGLGPLSAGGPWGEGGRWWRLRRLGAASLPGGGASCSPRSAPAPVGGGLCGNRHGGEKAVRARRCSRRPAARRQLTERGEFVTACSRWIISKGQECAESVGRR